MSALQKFLKDENEFYLNRVDEITSGLNELLNDKLYNYIKYAETDDISYLVKETEKLKGENLEKSKENVVPQKKTNQKKTTSLADTTYSTASQTAIKQEKISLSSVDSSSSIAFSVLSETSVRKNDIVKSEIGDMPAPSKLPPRKKKIKTEPLETNTRSTRSKTKPKCHIDHIEKSDKGKPSDVIVQNTTITMIDISEDNDSDTEKKTRDNEHSTRTTRTKTRQQNRNQEVKQPEKEAIAEPVKVNNVEKIETKHGKRIRSKSSTEGVETVKRTKSSSTKEQDPNKTGHTDYEDAVSTTEYPDSKNVDIQNATMVINSTMVVENSKINHTTRVQEEQGAKKEISKTPPRTKLKKQQIKEIFSPYEKSSLKKKVEAFEKFGSASKELASKIPLVKENGASNDTGSAIKTKLHTPFANKFMPKICSTSVINRNHPDKQKVSLYNDSGLSMKSLSAMKASQAEYREREKRRQEKEMEAQQKKDALLQAQAEETKRKREEKQLKAQQQRELFEKEKEKQIELQKLKDEKHKQALIEKEERIQKSKEDAEKKRLMVKNKAKILKEKEERQAAQKPQVKCMPIYMTTRPPLLPTEDCYDSDAEEYRQKHYVKPDWCREKAMNSQLYIQLIAGEKIKNTLFSCTVHNVDLVDIFENIDPKKLKRTSSALWRKPPRYTLFSTTSDIHFSEDSEDELDIIRTPRTKH